MAIKCGYFNSKSGDRQYSAEDMNKPFNHVISNGVFATQQGTPSDYLQVFAGSGMSVTVNEGYGMFKNKWFESDSGIALTLEASEVVLLRIDSIVVRIDETESVRSASIYVKKGTPASSPVAPTMEITEQVHEYRLADIMVNANVTELNQSNITDRRGSADCPWVTSLVQQVDTSTLFNQFEDAFYNWFDTVQTEKRNIVLSSEEPTSEDGVNGDLWGVYEE